MDLSIYETGNGGDVILVGNDLEVTNALFNQVYLAWFGGNFNEGDADAEDREAGEQRFDYWQNDLFYSNEESKGKIITDTEKMLYKLSLTSQGLYDLKETAEHDLEFLGDVGNISVDVSVKDIDKIELIAKLQQSDGDKLFSFVWDSTKMELINSKII